jgi:primosomal protein N'
MNAPCQRCGGLVVTEYGETHCIPCGWYFHPPDPPEALTMDPARWQSVLCARCNVVPAIYKRELCPKCQDARHQRQGYGHQKQVSP